MFSLKEELTSPKHWLCISVHQLFNSFNKFCLSTFLIHFGTPGVRSSPVKAVCRIWNANCMSWKNSFTMMSLNCTFWRTKGTLQFIRLYSGTRTVHSPGYINISIRYSSCVSIHFSSTSESLVHVPVQRKWSVRLDTQTVLRKRIILPRCPWTVHLGIQTLRYNSSAYISVNIQHISVPSMWYVHFETLVVPFRILLVRSRLLTVDPSSEPVRFDTFPFRTNFVPCISLTVNCKSPKFICTFHDDSSTLLSIHSGTYIAFVHTSTVHFSTLMVRSGPLVVYYTFRISVFYAYPESVRYHTQTSISTTSRTLQ